MSRVLPEDKSEWTEDDIAYASQRPWLPQPEVEASEEAPEDEGVDLTAEMVRAMNKDQVLALFQDPNLAGDLADVDMDQNKPELVDAVVTALFGED